MHFFLKISSLKCEMNVKIRVRELTPGQCDVYVLSGNALKKLLHFSHFTKLRTYNLWKNRNFRKSIDTLSLTFQT